MAVPAGAEQHRSVRHVVRCECERPDSGFRGARHVDDDSGEVGEVSKVQPGQVGAATVPMCRGVDVGAGVGNHGDSADLELGALGVAPVRVLPGQVVADLRAGQSWVGHHAVLDRVAQIDDGPAIRYRHIDAARALVRLRHDPYPMEVDGTHHQQAKVAHKLRRERTLVDVRTSNVQPEIAHRQRAAVGECDLRVELRTVLSAHTCTGYPAIAPNAHLRTPRTGVRDDGTQ